jgi:ParB-like chromosome segregation protein Spo0J
MFKSPVYNVIPVPLNKVKANDYNPNHVAKREMDLLYKSIKEDGYTMPVVCFYDNAADEYIIVDGFHRYTIMLTRQDIYERENGMLPVSVIDKDINDRMASTIRHNRARGKHEVELQASLVSMLKKGWPEERILAELGMTIDEIQRLLGIKGIASEIVGLEYSIEKQIKEIESVELDIEEDY